MYSYTLSMLRPLRTPRRLCTKGPSKGLPKLYTCIKLCWYAFPLLYIGLDFAVKLMVEHSIHTNISNTDTYDSCYDQCDAFQLNGGVNYWDCPLIWCSIGKLEPVFVMIYTPQHWKKSWDVVVNRLGHLFAVCKQQRSNKDSSFVQCHECTPSFTERDKEVPPCLSPSSFLYV